MEKHQKNVHVQLVYFPEQLFRKPALEQDLEFYNGPGWRNQLLLISPAQQAYLDSIENCCGVTAAATGSNPTLKRDQPRPELLAAHAYVRYLGDLSGGQILAKRLQKFNGLKSPNIPTTDARPTTGSIKPNVRSRVYLHTTHPKLSSPPAGKTKPPFDDAYILRPVCRH